MEKNKGGRPEKQLSPELIAQINRERFQVVAPVDAVVALGNSYYVDAINDLNAMLAKSDGEDWEIQTPALAVRAISHAKGMLHAYARFRMEVPAEIAAKADAIITEARRRVRGGMPNLSIGKAN